MRGLKRGAWEEKTVLIYCSFERVVEKRSILVAEVNLILVSKYQASSRIFLERAKQAIK